MNWNLGGKQNQPSLKGKQEEEKKDLGFCIFSGLPFPSPCSAVHSVGLSDLSTAYWENEESDISQELSFIINFQYLFREEINWQKPSC